MPPQISLINHQSYKQAAAVLGRAFVDDPVTIAQYRHFSPQRRIRALSVDYADEILLCMRKGLPLQLVEDERVVACAVVYPPGSYPLPAGDQWLLLAKSFVKNGFYDMRAWVRWTEQAEKLHPGEPHFYLEYLGVDPECQGKGYGSLILKHLASRADELGVGCYLENANPRNLPFYQRGGFQVLHQQPVIGLPAWFMWRPPAGDASPEKPALQPTGISPAG